MGTRTMRYGVPNTLVTFCWMAWMLASICGPSLTPFGNCPINSVRSSSSFMCMSMWLMPSKGSCVIRT